MIIDIAEDLKICANILIQYRNLSSEDGLGAYKLNQKALAMYDRFNELRLQVNSINLNGNMTKSDLKEYLRCKMKLMEYVHVGSRAIFNAFQADSRKFTRN